MKKLLVATLLMCLCGTMVAQNRVTGQVTSSEDGNPIPFASVVVKGTMNGVATDDNGRFTIGNVTLADNATAKALAEKLKSGSLTVEMKANGFEHYGPLGFSLERHDEQIAAVSGDIMLYNGNNICVFYGSNSWSYTPLGKVAGKTAEELKAFFGIGTVSVTYSLKQ